MFYDTAATKRMTSKITIWAFAPPLIRMPGLMKIGSDSDFIVETLVKPVHRQYSFGDKFKTVLTSLSVHSYQAMRGWPRIWQRCKSSSSLSKILPFKYKKAR
jgi:hypothetical protein